MFFLPPLAAGLLTGLIWARVIHRPYQPPPLQHLWLAPLAFTPQLLVRYWPAFPDPWTAAALLATQALLIGFALVNWRIPGMKILIAGAICNLAVMSANGGFMPISPLTAAALMGEERLQALQPGSRFDDKDILLLVEDTRLEYLADRYLTPDWAPYRAAYSLGDLLIAAGVFWMLANQGNQNFEKVEP